MKVKIKSWERMVEEFGWFDSTTINLTKFGWHKELEQLIPEDRIIEVESRYRIGEYHMVGYLYGISQDAIEEYLTDESGNDLPNPLHPANSELLPELKSEQEFKLKPLVEILEEESKPKATENYNNSIIKHLSKMQHRTHYYKFQLEFDNDYSIRYYLEFESRPECVGNYYLKSHSKNEYSLLPKEMAEDLIRKLCKIEAEEIIGRRSGKKYEKIVVGKDKLIKFTE